MIQMEYQVLIETVEETKQISSGVTEENIINILEEIINTKINEGYFLFLDLLNRCKSTNKSVFLTTNFIFL